MSPRLPYRDADDLPADAREAADRIIATRGGLLNVFRMLANSPGAMDAVARTGEYLRYRAPLDATVRELAILTVARHINCHYEWVQHWHAARKEGVPEALLRLAGKPELEAEPDPVGVSARYVRLLLAEQGIDDRTVARLRDQLGDGGLMDLTVLVGYYRLLGGVINTFGVELDQGMEPVPFNP